MCVCSYPRMLRRYSSSTWRTPFSSVDHFCDCGSSIGVKSKTWFVIKRTATVIPVKVSPHIFTYASLRMAVPCRIRLALLSWSRKKRRISSCELGSELTLPVPTGLTLLLSATIRDCSRVRMSRFSCWTLRWTFRSWAAVSSFSWSVLVARDGVVVVVVVVDDVVVVPLPDPGDWVRPVDHTLPEEKGLATTCNAFPCTPCTCPSPLDQACISPEVSRLPTEFISGFLVVDDASGLYESVRSERIAVDVDVGRRRTECESIFVLTTTAAMGVWVIYQMCRVEFRLKRSKNLCSILFFI